MSYYTWIKLDFEKLPLSNITDLDEKLKKCNLSIEDYEKLLADAWDKLLVHYCKGEIEYIKYTLTYIISTRKSLEEFYTLKDAIETPDLILKFNHFNYSSPKEHIELAKNTIDTIRRQIIVCSILHSMEENTKPIKERAEELVAELEEWKEPLEDLIITICTYELYINNLHKNEDDEDWQSQ